MPASWASASSATCACTAASSSSTASRPAAEGPRGAQRGRVGLAGGLPPTLGVAELRQAALDVLTPALDGLEPGRRGLHGVPGGYLLGPLAVERPRPRATHGGQHRGQPEPLEPLDVLGLDPA